ncbi:DMT family transporter [Corynebacterium sp. S7]
MSWIWLLLSIAAEVTGTLSMRASDGFRKKKWLIPMTLAYVVAFFFLGLTLNTGMPVGVAYGLWTAIGLVAISVLAKLIWNEPLTRRMLVGMGFIGVGVLLVELS